jgi:SAM-dependent methyltransferase
VPLALLPRAALVKTGPVDHADWNYHGLLGYVSRRRYNLVVRLLNREPVEKLLEVGFGSGVFLPELRKHCRELYGVDSHECGDRVARALQENGVEATLKRAAAEAMPFEDESFDCIVAVSTLEFVTDLPRAVRELSRILRPDGRAIVVVPGDHPLLDFGLRVVAGTDARRDFGDRRAGVIPALEDAFRIERRLGWPPLFGPLQVYKAVRLEPRKALALDPQRRAA